MSLHSDYVKVSQGSHIIWVISNTFRYPLVLLFLEISIIAMSLLITSLLWMGEFWRDTLISNDAAYTTQK